MGRGKAVGGLILVILGEMLIFLFVQPIFLSDILQQWVPLSIMMEISTNLYYLIWMFLVVGIILVAGGIYMIVKSKFPSKEESSGGTTYFG